MEANQVFAIALPLLKPAEGLHAVRPDGLVYPYLCPANYPTQGYGLLVRDLEAPPITPDEAERRLLAVLPKYLAATLTECPGLANEPPRRAAAILDFCFNLGQGALHASTLRRRVNARDWNGACAELGKWVWGGGRKLPGLVTRRAAEARLLA